jgi:four helix bundle protein
MINCNEKFKNKDIVERCIDYSLEVITVLRRLRKDFVINVVAKQLLRSATSIGANVVEAQACGSRKDFTNFLSHALKSANESKYWLYILAKVSKDSSGVKKLLAETVELANILGASIIKLRNK